MAYAKGIENIYKVQDILIRLYQADVEGKRIEIDKGTEREAYNFTRLIRQAIRIANEHKDEFPEFASLRGKYSFRIEESKVICESKINKRVDFNTELVLVEKDGTRTTLTESEIEIFDSEESVKSQEIFQPIECPDISDYQDIIVTLIEMFENNEEIQPGNVIIFPDANSENVDKIGLVNLLELNGWKLVVESPLTIKKS